MKTSDPFGTLRACRDIEGAAMAENEIAWDDDSLDAEPLPGCAMLAVSIAALLVAFCLVWFIQTTRAEHEARNKARAEANAVFLGDSKQEHGWEETP